MDPCVKKRWLTALLDYSCLHRARQGWLYISENYIGFHSFLLGLESKTLIELKDVQELKKERSKGIFDDSLRITTKDKEEVKRKSAKKRTKCNCLQF